MTIFQAILLGIVQGVTEFLPISSSGHLVLAPHLLGWDIPLQEAFLFDVLVQLGTLAAVVVYFWDDLMGILRAVLAGVRRGQPFADLQARMGWYLVLATLPAGAAGLLFRDGIKQTFEAPSTTALFLLLTAVLLVIGEKLGKRSRSLEALTWQDALWIGAFQILALLPGVSRSGATITGGMTRGLERPASARFAFLMATPIMLAAGLLSGTELLTAPNLADLWLPFAAGFITAALVGYLVIRWLLSYLVRGSLYGFAIYCGVVGITLLLWLNV